MSSEKDGDLKRPDILIEAGQAMNRIFMAKKGIIPPDPNDLIRVTEALANLSQADLQRLVSLQKAEVKSNGKFQKD